jgi:uncharacterized protein (DUF1697 family)
MKWGYKSQLDALELLLTQLTRTNLLDLAEFAPETAQVGRTEIYVYHPDGIGRNQAPRVRQPTPGVPSTIRNWNTTTKLLELVSS